MNYPNYAKAIVLSYSIILDGWPTNIPFTSPWNIHMISKIQELRDALNVGTCAWKRLMRTELKKYKEDLERCRSDSGTSWKRKKAQREDTKSERPMKSSRKSNKTTKTSRG
ncbi:hypothetical protein F4604DRAFT_1592266 [Suillus subluteus]|nr:hypothetical protein F4604DRAFT_1592266 [Suillus subluteus]